MGVRRFKLKFELKKITEDTKHLKKLSELK